MRTSGSVMAITMRKDGGAGVGGEELPPVDAPTRPVTLGPAGELLGVRTGLGLGHRVAGEDLTVEERLEVALLLLVGAVVGDDLGVSRVGRLGPEDDGGPLRHAQDLVEQGQLELAVALPAQLGTEVAAHRPWSRTSSFIGSTIGRSSSSSGWNCRCG